MKKFIALSALIASIGFGALSAEAKTSESTGSLAINTTVNAAAPQIRVQFGNRRARTVTRTRIVRVGRQRYRETYQTTYRPNGRVVTRIISRVRVR